eukprot:CAMPEP_0119055320 /NCGR_PEP_ID=MMETSP1177-20130426/75647_1 /TAXON_ID=2985 /ORGANISM="Ochromonas sp, Strain CCMP1899" /LENGTH=354 /DNA_ID=CAMNT_0007035825 /DNA_START=195 /DNA_END=1259 /DNA_ORIENTATION=+
MIELIRIQSQLENSKKQYENLKSLLQTTKQKLATAQSQNLSKPDKEIDGSSSNDAASINSIEMNAIRPGVIILGMHRSGTSIVGGLMNKMGLNTGGPLIQAAEDNAKGFFERIDVVIQNDLIFKKQVVHYAFNTNKYDTNQGLTDILSNNVDFREGKKALAFLNNENNYPWMLKDPRLCIALRTWLPLLNFIPAILYVFRHPFDVASSMNKRTTENFPLSKGLKLWYSYNKQAISKSNDLCRVVASHRSIMSKPQPEFDRIFIELNKCGVQIPHKVSSQDVNNFIDVKLQHGKSGLKDTACEKSDLSTLTPPESWPTKDEIHLHLYRESMRVYCALEDGSAFLPNFKWDESIYI